MSTIRVLFSSLTVFILVLLVLLVHIGSNKIVQRMQSDRPTPVTINLGLGNWTLRNDSWIEYGDYVLVSS